MNMIKAETEIMRRILAVIAVALGIALTGLAETVENVRGQQRENSKLVDIYYDLNDTDGGAYYVEVEVVGRTCDVNASSFSGDVGEGVAPGQNRRIVWDAGADWPGNKGDVKAVVTAIKGGKPNRVQLWEGGPYWADRNIGAEVPWESGLYFWWGDTEGHRPSGTTFSISFVKETIGGGQLYSKGWITANGVLVSRCDAAHVKWGGSWRMPTKQEFENLTNRCDWTWGTMNGVNGYMVCGRDSYASNSVFFPCAGYGNGTSLYNFGSYCLYWSSSPIEPTHGFSLVSLCLFFKSSRYSVYQLNRSRGLPVRPVQGFTE